MESNSINCFIRRKLFLEMMCGGIIVKILQREKGTGMTLIFIETITPLYGVVREILTTWKQFTGPLFMKKLNADGEEVYPK